MIDVIDAAQDQRTSSGFQVVTGVVNGIRPTVVLVMPVRGWPWTGPSHTCHSLTLKFDLYCPIKPPTLVQDPPLRACGLPAALRGSNRVLRISLVSRLT